ncbi:MAG TPA: prepilin-type N-terminal cleavage/methylation domain-containing protein [Opitutales bacterium]|nr:prepilin-type N-terminal cleavage/methylation domain-containing protein [Opitutales bacterium]
MNTRRDRSGFSLIELIVVVSVIAVLAGFAIWHVIGVTEASRNVADQRNVQTWNQAYSNVMAANPSFATDYPSWSDASGQLAAGVNITVDGETMTITASKPRFGGNGDPTFSPGTGITNIPAR